MTAIQPTTKSIFSTMTASHPASPARNPFTKTQSVDSFNGKTHFGSSQADQRVTANTHTLGRLDTFM